MIPKIIHYVWLGTAEMPDDIKACIDTWRSVMPDYEIKRWDESNIGEVDYPFVSEAIAERKWAFASDVIRLYALYTYGGIYLDTDVKVFKTFDPLLSCRAFTGRENSIHIIDLKTLNYITTCCLASEAGNPFIGRCLAYYNNRHFITSTDRTLPPELRLDMTLNSEVMCRLAQEIGYDPKVLSNKLQSLDNGVITIFPCRYFDPIGQVPESYCQHLAIGSWRTRERPVWKYTFKDKITWRIWKLVDIVMSRFDRIVIKLQ